MFTLIYWIRDSSGMATGMVPGFRSQSAAQVALNDLIELGTNDVVSIRGIVAYDGNHDVNEKR